MKKTGMLFSICLLLCLEVAKGQDRYMKAYMVDSLPTLAIQSMIGVDNSFILSGKADKGACLFKIDVKTSKTMWCVYDQNNEKDGILSVRCQDANGNLYVEGYKSGSNATYIAKFNKNGKLIKKRHLDNSFFLGWRYRIINENTILVPIMLSNPQRGGVMCLDSSLNIKWFKYINNPEASNYDMLINDKHIFVMGASTIKNSNKYEMMITKLTLQGEFVSAVIVRRANKELNYSYGTIFNGTMCTAVFDETGPSKAKSMLAFIDTSLSTISCKGYDTPQSSYFVVPNFSTIGELIVQGEMEKPNGTTYGRTTLASVNIDGSLNYFKATQIDENDNYILGPTEAIDKENNYYFNYVNSVLTILPPPQKSYYFKKQIISKFSLNDPDPCFLEDIPVSIVDIPLELVPLTVEVTDTMFSFAQSTTVFDFQYVDMVEETYCYEVSTKDQDTKNEIMNVFPNPAANHINVSANTSSNKSFPATFTLYDLIGRQVLSIKMNYGDEDIDISGISEGLYLWNLSSKGQIYGQGKLVVER